MQCIPGDDAPDDARDERVRPVAPPSHIQVVLPADVLVEGTYPLLRGSSRHAPYGMRFLALMRDGQYRTSHLSGDLVDRVRVRQPGRSKGGSLRGGLSLTPHAGEMEQLERAASYYRAHLTATLHAPTATQVCEHLTAHHLDRDYRKGATLARRNAGNFFKRLLAYLRTNQPNHRQGRQSLSRASSTCDTLGPASGAPEAGDAGRDAVDAKSGDRCALLKLTRGSMSVDTLVDGDGHLSPHPSPTTFHLSPAS
jgi:hypothetical protein